MESKRRKICPHCTQNISYSAYLSHKARYYDNHSSQWTQAEGADLGDDSLLQSADSEDAIDWNDDVSVPESDSSTTDFELEDEDQDYEDLEIGADDIELISSEEDSEDEIAVETKHVINFVSLFLTQFQLKYRLSNLVITTILKFLTILFTFLSKLSPAIKDLASCLPSSLYNLRKSVKLKSLHKQYIFCPTCYKLYDSDAKLVTTNDHGEATSSLCTHVAFPNHPQASRRQQCGEPLLKAVKCNHKVMFRPRQIFCYCSIKKCISILMEDCRFWDICNEWRTSTNNAVDSLSDIYHGKIWKEFLVYKGTNFLADRHNLAFMLNVDWFRPFEHTSHSVGVLYLTIMNLPRRLRYKFPYVLIIGIIPGPQEPSGTINTFIGPMVSELLELWQGCWLGSDLSRRYVRAALLCVSCDIPAARKVCGIVGHSALMGCSRCKKMFPTQSFGEKADYSGFDVSEWTERNSEDQKKYAYEHLTAKTAAKQKKIEREQGVKYSILNELPYYDTVHFMILDPMHLLFLGIAKHTFKTWTSKDIINNSHFTVIQDRVNKLITPSTLGRIPLKIGSGFAQLTADQWKNWICIFSPYCLFGILPDEDWLCWWLFVRACHIICKKTISLSECRQAQIFIVEYCKQFETLYGKENLVINMHMACHLEACILDYGPVNEFWCFGFERFNGILGSYPNNHLNVSVTMMKKFEDYLQSSDYTNVEDAKFKLLLTEVSSSTNAAGSLIDSCENSLLKPLREYILSHEYHKHLTDFYSDLYPNLSVVPASVTRSAKISYMGHILSSTLSRSKSGTCIAADREHSESSNNNRPHMGLVQFYFEHTIKVNFEDCVTQRMALVQWFKVHPDRDEILQPPLEIWEEAFMPLGKFNFLPINKILYPVAFTLDKLNTSYGNETVIVTMPIYHISN